MEDIYSWYQKDQEQKPPSERISFSEWIVEEERKIALENEADNDKTVQWMSYDEYRKIKEHRL